MAAVAPDNLIRADMVRGQCLAIILRIEARRQLGGADQIAKQHRDLAALAAFGLGGGSLRLRRGRARQTPIAVPAKAVACTVGMAAGAAHGGESLAAAAAKCVAGWVLVLARRTNHALTIR